MLPEVFVRFKHRQFINDNVGVEHDGALQEVEANVARDGTSTLVYLREHRVLSISMLVLEHVWLHTELSDEGAGLEWQDLLTCGGLALREEE